MKTSASYTEEEFSSLNGYVLLLTGLILIGYGGFRFFTLGDAVPSFGSIAIAAACVIAGGFAILGLYMLQPNEGGIITLFGDYRGTDRSSGLRWCFPFYSRKKISLRSRNLNSDKLKVNDKNGNPIEIGAALVWRVRDTAQAVFEIDDYELYVRVQSED